MKKKKTIVKKKESKKRKSDYWGTCFVSIWRAFFISEFLFLFRPHFSSLRASEKGRSKFLQILRLFIIKLSLIQIFFFRFIHSFTIHNNGCQFPRRSHSRSRRTDLSAHAVQASIWTTGFFLFLSFLTICFIHQQLRVSNYPWFLLGFTFSPFIAFNSSALCETSVKK
jgi:hypothetical protein